MCAATMSLSFSWAHIGVCERLLRSAPPRGVEGQHAEEEVHCLWVAHSGHLGGEVASLARGRQRQAEERGNTALEEVGAALLC